MSCDVHIELVLEAPVFIIIEQYVLIFAVLTAHTYIYGSDALFKQVQPI